MFRSAFLLILVSLVYSTAHNYPECLADKTNTLVGNEFFWKGNTDFATELYKTITTRKSMVFSPLSISSSLMMTYAGARG